MNSANKIRLYIEKINHTISIAKFNYDVWWTHKGKKYRKMLLDADEKYPSFFQTSIHAHFVALVIALYRLFEIRQDSINFPKLLVLLRKSDRFNVRDINNLERRVRNSKSLWNKIGILRNKVFGRLSNNLEVDPWGQARMKPRDGRVIGKGFWRFLNFPLTLLAFYVNLL